MRKKFLDEAIEKMSLLKQEEAKKELEKKNGILKTEYDRSSKVKYITILEKNGWRKCETAWKCVKEKC